MADREQREEELSPYYELDRYAGLDTYNFVSYHTGFSNARSA